MRSESNSKSTWLIICMSFCLQRKAYNHAVLYYSASLFSQAWFATPQLVLHALWQEVWHSPQPPLTALFAISRVSNVTICFMMMSFLYEIFNYCIFINLRFTLLMNRRMISCRQQADISRSSGPRPWAKGREAFQMAFTLPYYMNYILKSQRQLAGEEPGIC